MQRFLKIVLCLGAFIAVTSCSDGQPSVPNVPLRPGLVTTVKAFGEIFRSEVTSVKDGVVHWETTWNDQLVANTKAYLNIFNLYSQEENETVINDVPKADIDSLFPLAIGKEVAFSGRQTTRENFEGYPLYVTMHVIAEDTVEIQDSTYDVYMIDMTLQILNPAAARNVSITLWYSPELGLNLKTRTQVNGQNYWTRVIDIQSPEETERNRRGLGTVALD